MSNLIKYLIPLLGKTQSIDNKDVDDERVNLFLWMISNDSKIRDQYFLHKNGKTSTWDLSPVKAEYYKYIGIKNYDSERDVEIDLLIRDISERVRLIPKKNIIDALNDLVDKKLDYTAKSIIEALFSNINNNKLDINNIPSPVNSFSLNDIDTIADKLFIALGETSATLRDFNNPEGIKFTKFYHSKRPLAFSYEIDEFLARRILQDVSTANVSVGSSFLTDLDSSLVATTHEFYRKPENLNKLWTKEKDASGKEVEVEVQRGSNKLMDVTKNVSDCRGFQVNSNGKETCHKYLEECLNGNGIDKCRDFMKNKKFWGNADGSAKTEVKGMLPATALATLEKFGFRQVNVFDSVVKRNIFKVETVSSWLENLSKTISDPTEYNAIKGNENLIKYLTLLEVKINASPEILNKGITSSDGTLSFNPNKFSGQYAAQVGIRAKIPVASVIGPYKRFSNTLTTYGITGSNIVSPKFIVPIRVGGVMHGGNISDYVSKLDENYKFASLEFENQYKSFKNALNSAGKTIDPVDDKALTDLLESFKKSEKKIVISLKLIEKYIQLMDVFKNNDPRGVLTLSNLDLLVSTNKAQLEKGSKKQESLINALTTLSSVVENAVNVAKPGSVSLVPGSFTGSSFSHEN